jgi:hypothetical protein
LVVSIVIAGALGHVSVLTRVLVEAGHPAASATELALACSAASAAPAVVVVTAVEVAVGLLDEWFDWINQIDPTTTMAMTAMITPRRI